MLRVCLNCYGTYTTDSVYQWDLNHTLAITGLDPNYSPSVHFCNRKSTEAIVVKVTARGNSCTVPIPNELLAEPYDIIAYVYSYGAVDAKTVEVINIPLIKRPKPTDYVFTENEDILNFMALDHRITKYIEEHNAECEEFKRGFYEEFNERVERGEFTGPKGDKGDKGDTGANGVTVPANGWFTFEKDDDGNLYCLTNDDTSEIPFVYENGNLYYEIKED